MMNDFLTNHIITYMGNKRKLLWKINEIIDKINNDLGKDKIVIGDGFSGSGVVSRLFKTRANELYTNDISDYSETLNKCFLSNISNSEREQLEKYIAIANKHADNKTAKYSKAYVSGNWAPIGEISQKDRVYFTEDNGKRIDIIRNYIETIPVKYRPFLLAQLLVEASIHNNTNGQFSAYYKNGDIGQYGGKKSIDVKRITSPIALKMPVLSDCDCKVHIGKQDTNQWVKTLPKVDLMYYDPPYNKHCYSTYYFLLNVINNWNTLQEIPETYRGQPPNWFISNYNSSKNKNAEKSLHDLVKNTKATYILLSYNSGGIIPVDTITSILGNYGEVEKIPVQHNTYNRLKGVSEYKRTKEKEKIREYFWLLKKE